MFAHLVAWKDADAGMTINPVCVLRFTVTHNNMPCGGIADWTDKSIARRLYALSYSGMDCWCDIVDRMCP